MPGELGARAATQHTVAVQIQRVSDARCGGSPARLPKRACAAPRRRSLHGLLLSCWALCLGACAGTAPVAPAPPEQPAIAALVYADAGEFGSRPDIPTPGDIHRLTPAQRAEVLDYMDAPGQAKTPRHRRVFEFLERMTRGFDYRGETLMAADALDRASGNCLSLAILTTAVAEIAGVEVGYEPADDAPVFEWNGDVVTKGVHVRTVLYEPKQQAGDRALLLSRSAITIDYFPTRGSRFIGKLGKPDYLAMYYRNIAEEAIEQKDYRKAYWYALESLEFAPLSSAGLNMLGVVYARAGDEHKAEAIYRYGIEHADEKLSLLKNYRTLLLRAGRKDDAAAIEAQLARMDDPSPFHWIQLARDTYAEGDYDRAIGYFRRALELAPNMDQGYLGLAQAYYQAGRLDSARRALEEALDNAYRPSTRSLYQAKLDALSREIYD